MERVGGHQASFVESQDEATRLKDRRGLLLFLLAAGGVAGRRLLTVGSTDGAFIYPLFVVTFILACLLVLSLAPRTWQRWRVPAAAAARLSALPAALVWAADFYRPAGDGQLRIEYGLGSGPVSLLYFLSSVAWYSGAVLHAMSCIALHLPPLLSAALQLIGTAVVASANHTHCTTAYMQHHQTRSRIDAAYVLLEPAIAPLQPLLWLADVDASNPQRRCYCVLLALQVWGGLVAPLLLVGAAEARAYGRYRLQRLRRLLLLRGRQQRAERQHWTRAAAAAWRAHAEQHGLELSEPSTTPTTTSSSSGPDSPDSDEVRLAAAQAASLMGAPAPPGLLLPGDYQYELAYRAVRQLRKLSGWPTLLLGAAVCLVYAWHVLAYPWR